MISVIVYGRNDSHGYNLPKRAALSFNCIAEVLTHQDDEIIFVDCNTPDDLPTFPESIADTLTPRARRLLRILRLRPAQYEKGKNGTKFKVLEPLCRNVAIRRSNPRNRWILNTNTDMVFIPLAPDKSLSDVAAKLPDGFYELPRFEIPEILWETTDRAQPRAIIESLKHWNCRLHVDEMVSTVNDNFFDGPCDFPLALRQQMFAIHGMNEQTVLGSHVDSNLRKRLFLLNGETKSLLEHVQAYHCDHTRLNTVYHRATDSAVNDYRVFFNDVATSYLPLQAETWGLPKEKIEAVRLTEEYAGRYAKALERLLPGLSVPILKSSATPSPEFVVTCARLGRMLNCTEALSEAELVSATKALGSVFTAENPKDYIERSRFLIPRALLPLLSLYLAEAWKTGNESLAAAMEQIYGLLTAPREGAEPRTTVTVREPEEMPASKPDFLLRQSIGRAINRPGPLSRQELGSARQSVTELLGAGQVSSYLVENRARIHPATLPLLFHDRAEAERSGNAQLAQKLQNIYWDIQLEADDEAPWQTSEWSKSAVDSGWFAERTAVAGQKARQTFPLYLFVHLPKTAGTTFLGSIVPQVFQEGEAFVLRGDSVQNRADLHLLNTLTSEKFKQLKFIGGHFADLLSNFQSREVQRITLVREPVERCLSGYFHAMYHESTTPKWESFRKEKLCFSGFVERYQADNFHSFERMFSPELDAEENCSRVLRQFTLVGLTEKFPEFLFLLHSLHGWRLALFENRLVRQEKKGFSLSAEDRAGVRARDDLFWMFRREFELYERATKQFEALWNREVEGNRLVEFETYKSFLGDYQRICAALSPNHDEARKIRGQFETWLKDVSGSTTAPLLTETRTL